MTEDKINKKISWREEAWEEFLSETWDKKDKNIDFIDYTKEEIEKFLSKYKKSGQGEIRIFHYGHESLQAVKKRNISKIPITRSKWRIIKAAPVINFEEPRKVKDVSSEKITDGMLIGIKDSFLTKTNPGETTLLAIANYTNIISDFYSLKEPGVLFTGGRQKAGINLLVNGEKLDIKKAQIEIDGGFEWKKDVVIVEMKSNFKQNAFDTNQALIPLLKWKNLLKNKNVFSMVLLAQTTEKGIEYWAFDLIEDKKEKMKINFSKKYILNVN